MERDIIEQALTLMRSEPRIGPHFRPRELSVNSHGMVTIEAEVENVGQKRLALERIAGIRGVSGIIDRLHVRPAVQMSDDGIIDHLRKAFAGELSFRGERISEREGEKLSLVQDAPGGAIGDIDFEVADGIVTLNGAVPSLTAKRLAGVVAWWVPGVRDVINGIVVEPDEEDAPIQIEEAVRLALEKDPLVDASQIRVGARERTVRLTGLVRSDAIRHAAEADAWYVFGVDDVVNDIAVGT
jgi:osmotically-inducible protein OsmY